MRLPSDVRSLIADRHSSEKSQYEAKLDNMLAKDTGAKTTENLVPELELLDDDSFLRREIEFVVEVEGIVSVLSVLTGSVSVEVVPQVAHLLDGDVVCDEHKLAVHLGFPYWLLVAVIYNPGDSDVIPWPKYRLIISLKQYRDCLRHLTRANVSERLLHTQFLIVHTNFIALLSRIFHGTAFTRKTLTMLNSAISLHCLRLSFIHVVEKFIEHAVWLAFLLANGHLEVVKVVIAVR